MSHTHFTFTPLEGAVKTLSHSEDSQDEDEHAAGPTSSDSDWVPVDTLRARRLPSSPVRKKQKLLKHEKKTSGSRGARQRNNDYECRARAVAMLDTIPRHDVNGRKLMRKERLADACNKVRPKISKPDTLGNWATARGRAKIEANCGGHKIEEFAPGAPLLSKGGRGRKHPGRGIFNARVLDRRRNAKYPNAEEQTVLWAKGQRRQRGNKLTTRILRKKMLRHTVYHYPDIDVTGFKASTSR